MENTLHLGRVWFDVDLYAVGSPCQSWSLAGSKSGAADSRGGLMALIPFQIEKHKPRSFISENVKGLPSLFPKEFNWLIQALRDIQLPNGEQCLLSCFRMFCEHIFFFNCFNRIVARRSSAMVCCRLQCLLQAAGHTALRNSAAPRTGLYHRYSPRRASEAL